MNNSKKDVYIIDLILLIFLLLIFFLDISVKTAQIINAGFWVSMLIFLLIRYGFPKDKNYFKKVTFRYVLICCLSYVIIIYLSGLFLGFSRVVFSRKFVQILKNITIPVILIITQEISRYIISKKSFKDLKPYIIFTGLLCLNDILLIAKFTEFTNFEAVFIFTCVTVLPVIARQTLFSWMTYNVSFTPNFIVRFGTDLLIFFVPIYPTLGDYLESVLGLALPFAIYMVINGILKYHDKKKLHFERFVINTTIIPLIIFAGILVILISGVFKYKLIAIASDSMNPIYYRGDAIIYEKAEADDIYKGEILVFQSNDIVVTHRVMEKIEKGNKIYFRTKGDNNNSEDPNLVDESKVYGKVKYIVKYVGFPTLWYNDAFKK